jgi:hypothetical protein
MKLRLHRCPKRVIEIRIACVSIFPGEELVVFKTGKLHKKLNVKHSILHLPLSTVLFFMLCPVGKLFTEEYYNLVFHLSSSVLIIS